MLFPLVKIFPCSSNNRLIWFPADISANIGDDRGYEIIFPPANILKKYSVGQKGKLYPVVAHDAAKKQDIAKIILAESAILHSEKNQ